MKKVILSLVLVVGLIHINAQESNNIRLSLQECVRMAVEKNINVRTARIDKEKSNHKVGETRAALLPQVNINGNFTDNIKKPITLLPGDAFGRPGAVFPVEMGSQYNTNASISINQVLYNQTALTALKISRQMEMLNILGVEKASEEMATEISKLYFLSLTTTKQKALVEENIARTKRLSDIIKLLVDNGMGKETDYQRISVSLENLYTQQSNTASTLEQQLNLIKYMLEIPLSEALTLTDTAEMPLLSQNPQPLSDFSNHIDIRMLESQQEVNRLSQKKIANSYRPSLSLTGQYAYQGYRNDFKNYFKNSPENNWYGSSFIGVTFSVPIFDGFEKRSKSRQARLDYQRTSMTLSNAKERFDADYRNAMNNYRNHNNNVQRQKQNIELAENVYKETALKYREGLATMSDVLQDEMGLSNAQAAYLSALYNFKEAELNILSLNGEIRNLFQ